MLFMKNTTKAILGAVATIGGVLMMGKAYLDNTKVEEVRIDDIEVDNEDLYGEDDIIDTELVNEEEA